jgi:hypothetical protein
MCTVCPSGVSSTRTNGKRAQPTNPRTDGASNAARTKGESGGRSTPVRSTANVGDGNQRNRPWWYEVAVSTTTLRRNGLAGTAPIIIRRTSAIPAFCNSARIVGIAASVDAFIATM